MDAAETEATLLPDSDPGLVSERVRYSGLSPHDALPRRKGCIYARASTLGLSWAARGSGDTCNIARAWEETKLGASIHELKCGWGAARYTGNDRLGANKVGEASSLLCGGCLKHEGTWESQNLDQALEGGGYIDGKLLAEDCRRWSALGTKGTKGQNRSRTG